MTAVQLRADVERVLRLAPFNIVELDRGTWIMALASAKRFEVLELCFHYLACLLNHEYLWKKCHDVIAKGTGESQAVASEGTATANEVEGNP